MFSDVGMLELITLAILAVLLFGPDKLPQVVRSAADLLHRIREFSETAQQDLRSELGPDFQDFEFEDLRPKAFLRKQLQDNGGLEIDEIRNAFDLRPEMTEVADAVQGLGRGPGVSSDPVSLPRVHQERPVGGRPPVDPDTT
ncbi:Sec-independent protein translocase subunit TatB [Streptomyces althioticus]|uniref:Sec-independent protein translocase subunit TatB n=1 Tax=Streptomyces TaxID=1883 RepID=UPI0033D7B5BE